MGFACSCLRFKQPRCSLTSRRECPPLTKSQKIINLALSPAMVLGRERVDACIDANVTNKEFRALDEVSYLINISSAETAFVSCHRPAPSLLQGISVLWSPPASDLV
jgi:hypothetical protein